MQAPNNDNNNNNNNNNINNHNKNQSTIISTITIRTNMAPLLWRFPKSRNPYNVKPFLTDISVTVAQIKKIKKTRWHFFGHFDLVRTLSTIKHPLCVHARGHLACTGHCTAP